MPAHRFFLEDLATPTLSGEEFHHLKNVMRARPGETLELVDGKGTLAIAKVVRMANSEASLEIVQKTHTPSSSTRLILAQALLRPSLLDWVIEKGTELGATHFWLFPADFSEKKELTPHQLARLEHIILSALKQSGRLYLPSLEIHPPLSRWEKPGETLLFGSLKGPAKPLDKLSTSVIMAIGPEKGFSREEHQILEGRLGGIGVRLNANTLRAETAALCALSLLSGANLMLD